MWLTTGIKITTYLTQSRSYYQLLSQSIFIVNTKISRMILTSTLLLVLLLVFSCLLSYCPTSVSSNSAVVNFNSTINTSAVLKFSVSSAMGSLENCSVTLRTRLQRNECDGSILYCSSYNISNNSVLLLCSIMCYNYLW